MQRKPPRPKPCAICKKPFTPRKIGQKACSVECACIHGEAQRRRERGTQTRQMKRKQNGENRGHQAKLAQTAFNAYIRARDKDQPCISSGRPLTGKYDAGHFRSVGSNPELRFHEDNCHGQTVHDNRDLHGNLLEYRKRLIDRIGLERVEWLEGPHQVNVLTIEDLKAITAEYKRKKKEIEK